MTIEDNYNSIHNRIPPSATTYNSDVETFHRLVEDEFFDIEGFGSMDDFMSKIRTYNIFFNNFRTNSYKENKSPLQILKEIAPEIDTKVTLLPPINLDEVLCYYINERGYHVPDFP